MLLSTCEKVLNERLGQSTAARERLAGLEGRRLAVEVAGTEAGFVLEARSGRITLYSLPAAGSARAAQIDATLRAGPLGLLALARSRSVAGLRQADAELAGKPHVAEGFAEMLGFLRPELEEELADWVGDIAAHEIGRLLHHAGDFAERMRVAIERDLSEYLQEENPLLARRLEIETFADDVDRLRDDVERLGARVELLARRALGSV